jgi:hypothetical protein
MMQETRRRLLEAALVYYQEFIEVRRDDPDAQAELAVTRDLVRSILNDLAVLQGTGRHFLLKESAVRDELALSEEQRAQLTQLFEEMDKHRHDAFEKLRQLPPKERQQRILAEIRPNENAIALILKPAQMDRLRQIAWQCHGPMAFHDPDIIAELKLTAEQKKQIRAIEANVFFEKMPPPFGEPLAMPFGQGPDGVRKSVTKQILAVLDETQTQRWNQLIGQPFAHAGRIFLPPGPLPGGFMPPPFEGKRDFFGPK